MKEIAIITGASSGLGSDFATFIDKTEHLDEIWLVARREDRLLELSKKLKTKAVILALDLTQIGSIGKIQEKLKNENPNLRFLINNAGYGLVGRFDELDKEKQLRMIDLNTRALTELTLVSLPFIQKDGKIIQVASSAGYAPLGNFAVYAATKSYVLHFSLAISGELKQKGIYVLAVCPGPVKTEFFEIAGGKPPKLAANSQDVVRLALKDSKKRKTVSVYGFAIKAFVVLTCFLPKRLIVWLSYKVKA
ncbi:MAG: SDR family NAD(P)-dependent oxidoreductase [Leptospiraceae bacterium]|nr:SDR family NAD(P)-dependent oxidoreductase [Leptospiraceae bacterium]MCP5494366.1 SDR family NAD(P)-dependent oxidoreductase [Leptospiraceae bacterium]